MRIDFIPYNRLSEISKIVGNTRIIAGIGVFDGVHLGHKRLIAELITDAKKTESESAIITFHPPTRFLLGKNKYLLTTNLEKFSLFKDLGIKRVIVFEFNESFSKLSPMKFLEIIGKLEISILYVGYDFRFGYKRSGNINLMKDILKSKGIGLKIVDILNFQGKKISSTNIKEYILEGNIKKANICLGYDFFITGIPFKKGNTQVLITHVNKIRPKDGRYNVTIEGLGRDTVKIQNGIIYTNLLNSGTITITFS